MLVAQVTLTNSAGVPGEFPGVGQSVGQSPITDGLTLNFKAPFDNGYAIFRYTVVATPVDPPAAAVAYRGPQTLGGAQTVTVNVSCTAIYPACTNLLGPDVEFIRIPSGYLVADVNYTFSVFATNQNGDGTPSADRDYQMCQSVPPQVA